MRCGCMGRSDRLELDSEREDIVHLEDTKSGVVD